MYLCSNPKSTKKKHKNPFTFLFHKSTKPVTFTEKKGIFGTPLCDAARYGSLLWNIKVPDPVYLCFKEIAKRGLDTEGLFRLSGATGEVSSLENMLNTSAASEIKGLDMSMYDIHTITSLVKKYIRELSEPVIPVGLHPTFLKIDPTHTQSISQSIIKLPYYNRQLLHAILLLSSQIQDHVHSNMMGPEALATVFAPVCTGFEKSLKDMEVTIKTKKSKTSPLSKMRDNALEVHVKRNKNWTNLWKCMIENSGLFISLLSHEEESMPWDTVSDQRIFNPYQKQLKNRSLPSPFSARKNNAPLSDDIMMKQFYPVKSDAQNPVIPVIAPSSCCDDKPVFSAHANPRLRKKETKEEDMTGESRHGFHSLTNTFFPKAHTVRKILSASTLR